MRKLLYAVLGIALIAYLLTGVVEVRPGERAVVRRFGRVLDQRPEPGLWIGLPWGMDRVDRVAVDRVQTVTVGFDPDAAADPDSSMRSGLAMPAGELLTGDHNLVDVRVVVSFRVRPDEVVQYVLERERVEPLLSRTVESALGEWVAGRTVDDVLLEGKQTIPADLVRDVQERLAAYRLGVEVLDARVVLIAPPDEVRWAFDKVAQEQTGIRTKLNKAEQEREAKRETARADAHRTEQRAVSDAERKVGLAQANASRFTERLSVLLEAMRKNPDYLRLVWAEERARLLQMLQETGQMGVIDELLREEKK
jgi:membrane protease subunit HflK